MKSKIFLGIVVLLIACEPSSQNETNTEEVAVVEHPDKNLPFEWGNANVYFMLTDRFYNGDTTNDQSFNRKADGAVLRSFTGGDIKGIIKKLDEGYFADLGINAIWFTPVFDQVRGFTDEGTGKTYSYHGYWPRDWTTTDPNFGTPEDLKELVDKAHGQGIRVLMDIIINHTGPVTAIDSQWPDDWVRTSPTCKFQDFETTVTCTLVDNLPDIKTESDDPVEIPQILVDKWTEEGRLEQETEELDAFFEKTGYPRAARFYIIKWLVDYIKEYGIDGFRVDTAKHTEPTVWSELYEQAIAALKVWKQEHTAEKLDDKDFFMVGEVYGYSIGHGQNFPMGGDDYVNFYENGFKSLINFAFKSDAGLDPEETFSNYSQVLNGGALSGFSTMNYISSHDDGGPFDALRERPMLSGTMLMLTPGAAQVYYGDETARVLRVDGASGDANLRSEMNWDELADNIDRNGHTIGEILTHWQKLGRFRKEHVSVGAGIHEKLADEPYTFKRSYSKNGLSDAVIVVMGANASTVDVSGTFEDGITLKDYYTGNTAVVEDGQVTFNSTEGLVLIGQSL